MTDISKIIFEAASVTDPAKLVELGLDSKEKIEELATKLEQMMRAEANLAGVFSLDKEARRELTALIKANPNNYDPVFKWIEDRGQTAYVDGYVTAQYVSNLAFERVAR